MHIWAVLKGNDGFLVMAEISFGFLINLVINKGY